MKKITLGITSILSIIVPIGLSVSCSMDELIGNVAIIKENKGFVVIASILSNKLTKEQASNSLKALKHVYDKQKLTSDLTLFEIGASDSENTMKFSINSHDIPKINFFLKGDSKEVPQDLIVLLMSFTGKLMVK